MDINALFDSAASLVGSDTVSHVASADITGWSVKIGVVWYLMNGKVNGLVDKFEKMVSAMRSDFQNHVDVIEKGFGDVTTEMKDLKEKVTEDLGKHSDILDTMKSKVSELTTRVEKLEIKKE